MADFQKRLDELSQYDISLEIRMGYYHISLVYNENWAIVDSDNESIYVEKRDGRCHYIATVGSATIDELLDTIQQTIDYNLDLERKLELFKQKNEELREIFAKESIETLETIQFTFGKKNKKVKKKSKAVSDEDVKKDDPSDIIENNVAEEQPTEKPSEETYYPEESGYNEEEVVYDTNQSEYIEEEEA